MKRTSRLTKILLPVNIVLAVLLAFSVAAKYTHPGTIGWMPFMGLAFPFLAFLHLLFIAFWVVRKERFWMVSVGAVLLSWGTLNNFVQLSVQGGATEKSVKVLSYNVRLFDLYNWTENKTTRNKIFDMLQEEEADILCFQEFFYSEKPGYFNTLDTLLKLQPANKLHTQYNSTKQQVHHFGIATFSRFPILNKGRVDLQKEDPSNNDCIYTDLLVHGDTLRVYNFHLASIHFGNDDYRFLQHLGEQETDEQIKGSRQILQRLKVAFQKRAKQANLIANHIATSPYPVMVCGDMNDSPASYAYNLLAEGLEDAFVEKGLGMGTTYNGLFPAFRIDYILHSDSWNTLQYNTIKRPYSDHFPITAVLEKEE